MVDKLSLMQRLRAEGQWDEAERFKNTALAEFKAKGVKDAAEAAWAEMAAKFPPAGDDDDTDDDDIDDDIDDDDEPPDEALEPPTHFSPSMDDIDDEKWERMMRMMRKGESFGFCTECLRERIVRLFDKIARLEAYIGRHVVHSEAVDQTSGRDQPA